MAIGRYRLERLIGRGGSAEVWLAWDDGPVPRPVAVKLLRMPVGGSSGTSEAADRTAGWLRDEAALVASLDHPHLLGVLDVIADGRDVAQVMPLARGGSLRDLLDERGTLAAGELVALLAPVADAVASLHRAGLVHGDLKPENILLTSEGAPMVADLGATRPVGEGSIGAEPATPAYLDPVRAIGGPIRPTNDVYALGVIAYEALCGRLPHRGDPAQMLALAAAGVHRPLATWPGIAPAVADAVEAAIDADPAQRPAEPTVLTARLAAASPASSIRLPGPAATALGEPRPPTHETILVGPDPAHADGRPDGPGLALVLRVLATVGVVIAAVLAVVALSALGHPHQI